MLYCAMHSVHGDGGYVMSWWYGTVWSGMLCCGMVMVMARFTIVARAFRHCSIATFYIVPTVWLPSFWATAFIVWTTQRRIRNRWDRSWWPFWWHGDTHFGSTWWTWWHGETLFGDGMLGLFAIFLFNREVTGQVVYQFVWHLSTFIELTSLNWQSLKIEISNEADHRWQNIWTL